MPTLAIVLARGGSKGLPRKNALPLAGRPMLHWTIDHAKQSHTIDAVVLSTDDAELATIGQAAGIDVIQRPADLAHDTATVDAAARHALDAYNHQTAQTFDRVVILYGNVPVRPADLTDRAVTALIDTGCDSVQSVYRVGKNHPFWMKTVTGDQDGGTLNMYIDNHIHRRQDLPPVYMLDGGLIAVTAQSLATVVDGQPHAFLGTDRRAVITQEGQVLDIDTPLDLTIATALLTPAPGSPGSGEQGVAGARCESGDSATQATVQLGNQP